MRNALQGVGLIARREYLQRVRTKAFLLTTLLTPAIFAGFALAPGYFMTRELGGEKTLVVVTDDPALGAAFAKKMQSNAGSDSNKAGDAAAARKYEITVDSATASAERKALDQKLLNQEIDGYVWLTRTAVENGKVELHERTTTDLLERDQVETAATAAAIERRAAALGAANIDVDRLLKPVKLETVQAGRGETSEDNTFIFSFMLVLAMYMPVVIQVVAVMRSVIEEKTSRVMEVMLATVTAKQLMAGKIIGVGAVGLTQIAIWALLGAFAAVSGGAASGMLSHINFSAAMIIYFVIFYLLGYLLYSAFAAAVGAAVNSEEEAQQMQFFVMMPLIFSMMLISLIFRDPSSGISVGLSLFPFFAPILMYLRILLEQPPLWQIALSIALLAAAAYAVLVACARIYRVGILMYGKRPTLPEILKWMRYA